MEKKFQTAPNRTSNYELPKQFQSYSLDLWFSMVHFSIKIDGIPILQLSLLEPCSNDVHIDFCVFALA